MQRASGTDIVPTPSSFRNELLTCRSRRSGVALGALDPSAPGAKTVIRIALTVALVIIANRPSTTVGIQRTGTAVAADLRLSVGAAGPIRVGQSVDDLFVKVGRENTRLVDLFTEGMFQPALEIRLAGAPNQPALTVPIREWPCREFSVWGITVRDPRFRTADGLGIGSSLADIRKVYSPEIGIAEGQRIAHVPELGLTFALDDSPASSDSWRVTHVWVVPQPALVRQARCSELGPLGKRGGA